MPDLDSLRKRLDALPFEPSQLVAGAVVVLVALVAGVSWLASGGGRRAPSPADAAALPHAAESSSTTAAAEFVVHVSGAVARPGLVRLPTAARVADALEAAGGVATDADVDRLNLAARLADGERVHVPRRGEAVPEEVRAAVGGAGGSAARAAPVDLNTATVEQLDALPGIGPATAQAIVDHRSRHGPFRSVAQLLQVKGIGEAKLAALRPKVRI